MLAIVWGALTMMDNRAAVEIVLLVPRLDGAEPFVRERYRVDIAAMLAGWGVCVCVLLLLAVRAPFWVRSAALAQRRMRELQREVLELRRLPLRQREEDEILAAEAHLDGRAKKVMTEKIRREAGSVAASRSSQGPRA